MTQDNLYTGPEVQEKLIAGINKVANAVGGTMGTGGSNAILEAIETPGHLTTNDGFSIANSVYLSDPIENMGKNILLESINRANKQSGDGSSTTCVLTRAVIEEGRKHLKDISPMELKRSLEACIPLIEESINKQKREITVDEVGPVAAISAESEEIGALIQEIYQQIGKDGIIHWDISKTTEDSYTIGNGLTIEGAGYYSPYMCDADQSGNNTNKVRLDNPTILITKQKISSASDFESLFETLFNKSIKDVVVFCDEIEPLVMPDLIKLRMMRGFRTIIVKMPVLWKDQWFEDLALASGATVIDPQAGITMAEEHLGKVGNIVITKDETYIDGIKDLSSHIKELQDEATDDSLLRASRLNTKTARYFIGAHSESALSYRRLKAEDAIGGVYQALQGGVVAGGGVALRKIFGDNYKGPIEDVGQKILHLALQAPEMQIWKNAGITFLAQPGPSNFGVDTRTGETVDMFEAHITDPAPVVLNAVKNAISVAATILTVHTLVTLPREHESKTI